MDANDRRINPEDELFWKKVREAHDYIRPLEGATVTVTIGNKLAQLVSLDDEEDPDHYCAIYISEVEIDPPTLVVP